jgi:hypothetical protein
MSDNKAEVGTKENLQRISFRFRPYQFEKKNHVIEKSEGGHKRRYLVGITSGIKTDGHDERMTADCIKSFVEQSNSGTVLLYPDAHGIRVSEDIGILSNAKIEDSGDWHTEYRLYDELDNVGPIKLEKIETLWRQSNGIAPYPKPIQKGFSIEGYIPEDGILSAEKDSLGNLSHRIINKVLLDGVILVPRPAYKDSIAHSVYKALGELAPWKVDKIKKSIQTTLSSVIEDKTKSNEYFRKRWEIGDALDKIIEDIMTGRETDKKSQLEMAFEEYKNLMTGLLLSSSELFTNDDDENEIEAQPYGNMMASKSKLDLYKSLYGQIQNLVKIMKSK